MIAEGASKLSSVPSGGAVASSGGSAAAASGGAAPAAAAEEKKEEKAEEKASSLLLQDIHNPKRYFRRSPTMTWASVSSTNRLLVLHYCLRHDHSFEIDVLEECYLLLIIALSASSPRVFASSR